jgi:hypothetical protein
LILDAVLLALVHLVCLEGDGPVACEIALSSIYGPPAECNTLLHMWLYYIQAEKSEDPCENSIWQVGMHHLNLVEYMGSF